MSIDPREGVGQKMEQLVMRMSTSWGFTPVGETKGREGLTMV
jgi:hypothetical protein